MRISDWSSDVCSSDLEAIYLTNHSHDVTLIHRRDSLRAEKILQDRLFANPKISVIWDTVVDEFVGEGTPVGLTSLKLRNIKTGEASDFSARSEEHTSELQSLMRISYAVFCLKKKKSQKKKR